MIRCLYVLVFMWITHFLFSQELGTFQRLEAGFNGIGLSLETPVAKRIVLEPAIGLGPSYDLDKHASSLMDKIDYHWALLEPSLHLSINGKYFYNRDKRLEKKRSLLLNSGSYIGVKVKYVTKSLSDPQLYSNTLLTNVSWGRQRNMGRHWLFSYSVGLGYGYNIDTSYGLFYPAIDLKVAYVLPFFSKIK